MASNTSGFTMDSRVIPFLRESLMIEGIDRAPTDAEILATGKFLDSGATMLEVCDLQKVYAPRKPLRSKLGLNVRVGDYIAPNGGPDIATRLMALCDRLRQPPLDPWRLHVDFETLHPFMDGNGRTGRALWAWAMQRTGRHPFELPFLHRFYYQTLEHADGR